MKAFILSFTSIFFLAFTSCRNNPRNAMYSLTGDQCKKWKLVEKTSASGKKTEITGSRPVFEFCHNGTANLLNPEIYMLKEKELKFSILQKENGMMAIRLKDNKGDSSDIHPLSISENSFSIICEGIQAADSTISLRYEPFR